MIFPKDLSEELKKLMDKLSKDNQKLQKDVISNTLKNVKKDITSIDQDDITIFHTILKIYHHGFLTNEQKKEILEDLNKLHASIKKTKDKIYNIKEDYSNINLLIKLVEDFIKHETEYINYSPGAQKREYTRLSELVNNPEKKLIIDKAALEIKEDKVYYDGKIIQGLTIKGDKAEITGQHYSNRESIERIYHHKEMSTEGEPYCYIAEPGKLAGKNEKEIKKFLGARHADSNITFKVIIPAHLCWIRAERGSPAKFALETKRIYIAPPKPQKGYRLEIEGNLQWAA